jgi:hypothetical protein
MYACGIAKERQRQASERERERRRERNTNRSQTKLKANAAPSEKVQRGEGKRNIAPLIGYYHTITCNCLCCDLL